MMTDDLLARIPKLVKRLRGDHLDDYTLGHAADALESAQARIAELEVSRSDFLVLSDDLTARLRKAEQERDRLLARPAKEPLVCENCGKPTSEHHLPLLSCRPATKGPPQHSRCPLCGAPKVYLDSADEWVHTFAADAEACARAVTEHDHKEKL